MIMEKRNLFSSLCLFIGGILSIIPALPLKNNLFPIYTYNSMVDIVGSSWGAVSFWGKTDSRIGQRNGPFGWTPLGIPTIILVFIFIIMGILAMILVVNTFVKIIPSKKFYNIPIQKIIGYFAGLVILSLDFLIFIGDVLNPYANGLSETLQTSSHPVAVIITASPGLGYGCLILSGLLIIFGTIIKLDTSLRSNFLKKEKYSNIADETNPSRGIFH